MRVNPPFLSISFTVYGNYRRNTCLPHPLTAWSPCFRVLCPCTSSAMNSWSAGLELFQVLQDELAWGLSCISAWVALSVVEHALQIVPFLSPSVCGSGQWEGPGPGVHKGRRLTWTHEAFSNAHQIGQFVPDSKFKELLERMERCPLIVAFMIPHYLHKLRTV